MLLKLNRHISACYKRAAECKSRAERATDPELKADFANLESSWTHLARSYECVESLERFLLSAYSYKERENRTK
jgi:hypothetical protein